MADAALGAQAGVLADDLGQQLVGVQSALPRRTNSTTFAAAAWLCGTSTTSFRRRD
jgi:hypothetical protein